MAEQPTAPVTFAKDDWFLPIRQSMITICGEDRCAAMLLTVMVRWHEAKYNRWVQAKKTKPTDTDLYMHFTADELCKEIYGFFGRDSIRKSLEILKQKRFILECTNPRKHWVADRTKHFIIQSNVIQAALKIYYKSVKPPADRDFVASISK
jgi:hypothetical protein